MSIANFPTLRCSMRSSKVTFHRSILDCEFSIIDQELTASLPGAKSSQGLLEIQNNSHKTLTNFLTFLDLSQGLG